MAMPIENEADVFDVDDVHQKISAYTRTPGGRTAAEEVLQKLLALGCWRVVMSIENGTLAAEAIFPELRFQQDLQATCLEAIIAILSIKGARAHVDPEGGTLTWVKS